MCVCVYTHVHVKGSSRVILPECDLRQLGLKSFSLLSPVRAPLRSCSTGEIQSFGAKYSELLRRHCPWLALFFTVWFDPRVWKWRQLPWGGWRGERGRNFLFEVSIIISLGPTKV